MKKLIILTLLFFTFIPVYSQDTVLTTNFNVLIRESFGDLNKDGQLDRVIISMDTVNQTKPFKLDVFFTDPNEDSKLFFSSTTLIEPMSPIQLKGEHNGSQIPDVSIEDGLLQIDFYIKGNSSYQFRYKNESFELVHFTHVYWDGESITETEFNLLTGKYTKQTEHLEKKEITLQIEKEVLLNPLPQLESFMPFENELY
jgi:hypothetical protein